MARSNLKFAAAVAAAPAELSGVSKEGHAECVRKTQQARMPDRYDHAQEYAFYATVMEELGESMLRMTKQMMSPVLLEKRYGLTNTRPGFGRGILESRLTRRMR